MIPRRIDRARCYSALMSSPVPTSTVAFHQSLLGRSMLFGVLPSALVVLAVVGLNSYRAWDGLSASLERDLRNATELAAKEINLRNEATVRLVRMMVLSQESGQFGRRADTLRFLESILNLKIIIRCRSRSFAELLFDCLLNATLLVIGLNHHHFA